MATNRFITTIRENVKYPNEDGQYGKWDGLDIHQRQFLINCANYMEGLENELENLYAEKCRQQEALKVRPPYWEKLLRLRALVQGYDIPNPTTVEGISHHNCIMHILRFINVEILEEELDK